MNIWVYKSISIGVCMSTSSNSIGMRMRTSMGMKSVVMGIFWWSDSFQILQLLANVGMLIFYWYWCLICSDGANLTACVGTVFLYLSLCGVWSKHPLWRSSVVTKERFPRVWSYWLVRVEALGWRARPWVMRQWWLGPCTWWQKLIVWKRNFIARQHYLATLWRNPGPDYDMSSLAQKKHMSRCQTKESNHNFTQSTEWSAMQKEGFALADSFGHVSSHPGCEVTGCEVVSWVRRLPSHRKIWPATSCSPVLPRPSGRNLSSRPEGNSGLHTRDPLCYTLWEKKL